MRPAVLFRGAHIAVTWIDELGRRSLAANVGDQAAVALAATRAASCGDHVMATALAHRSRRSLEPARMTASRLLYVRP